MKKKIILIFTICFIAQAFAQKNAIVSNITGFKDQTKVKLFDQDLGGLIDSAYVINNSFVLKHNIQNSYPKNLTLVMIPEDGPISVRLFIANDNLNITGDRKDFPYDLKISGSKNQDLENILVEQTKGIDKERAEIVKFLRTEVIDSSKSYKNKRRLNSIRMKQIDKQNDSIVMKFIDKNINSYVALNQLKYIKHNYATAELTHLYKRLDEKHKMGETGKSLLTYIEIGDFVKEGDLYSDFEAKDANGKTHKLSDFKGQFVLLDFTKEFCAPCEAAIKELKIIDAKYADKVKIISFNGEKSEAYWKKGIVRNNIKWLSLWDGMGNSGKTLMKYNVQGFPTFFFINPEGIVVKRMEGYGNDLETELLKLLN